MRFDADGRFEVVAGGARPAAGDWLPLPDGARAQHARGRHGYDAAQFGLDPGALRERFRGYEERFGLCERATSAGSGAGAL